jgi:hypothetical protein
MLILRDHTRHFELVSKRIMSDVEKLSKYLKVYKIFDKIFKGSQFLSRHQGSSYQNPSDVGQWTNRIDAIFLKLFNEDEDGDWHPHYRKISARQNVSHDQKVSRDQKNFVAEHTSELLQARSKRLTDSQIDNNSLMFVDFFGNQDKKKNLFSRKMNSLTTFKSERAIGSLAKSGQIQQRTVDGGVLTLIQNANNKDAQQDGMIAVVKPTQSASAVASNISRNSNNGSEVGGFGASAKGGLSQGRAPESTLAQALRLRSADANTANTASEGWSGLTTFKSERAIGSLAKSGQIQQRTVDGGVLTLIQNANNKDAQQDGMIAVVKPTQSASAVASNISRNSNNGSEVGGFGASAKGGLSQGRAPESTLAQALRLRSADANTVNTASEGWSGLTTFKSERAIGSLAKSGQIQQRTVDGGVLTLIQNANNKDAQQDGMIAVVKPTQSASAVASNISRNSNNIIGSEVGGFGASAKGGLSQGRAPESTLAQALRLRSADANTANTASEGWSGLTTFKSERAIGSLAKSGQIQQRTVDGGVLTLIQNANNKDAQQDGMIAVVKPTQSASAVASNISRNSNNIIGSEVGGFGASAKGGLSQGRAPESTLAQALRLRSADANTVNTASEGWSGLTTFKSERAIGSLAKSDQIQQRTVDGGVLTLIQNANNKDAQQDGTIAVVKPTQSASAVASNISRNSNNIIGSEVGGFGASAKGGLSQGRAPESTLAQALRLRSADANTANTASEGWSGLTTFKSERAIGSLAKSGQIQQRTVDGGVLTLIQNANNKDAQQDGMIAVVKPTQSASAVASNISRNSNNGSEVGGFGASAKGGLSQGRAPESTLAQALRLRSADANTANTASEGWSGLTTFKSERAIGSLAKSGQIQQRTVDGGVLTLIQNANNKDAQQDGMIAVVKPTQSASAVASNISRNSNNIIGSEVGGFGASAKGGLSQGRAPESTLAQALRLRSADANTVNTASEGWSGLTTFKSERAIGSLAKSGQIQQRTVDGGVLTLIQNANNKDAQQDGMIAVVKPTQSASAVASNISRNSNNIIGSEVGEFGASAKGGLSQGRAPESTLAQALRLRSADANTANTASEGWSGLTTFKSERAIGSLAKSGQIQQRTVDGGVLTLIQNANNKDAQQDGTIAVVKPTQSASAVASNISRNSNNIIGSEVGGFGASAKGGLSQGRAPESTLAQALRLRSADANTVNTASEGWSGLTTFKSERAIGSLAKSGQIQQRTVDGGVLTLIQNANNKDAQQDGTIAVVKPTQSASAVASNISRNSNNGSEVGGFGASAKGGLSQGRAPESTLAQALRLRSADANTVNTASEGWSGLTTFKSERAIGSLAKSGQIQQRTVDGGVLTLIQNANNKDAQQDGMIAVVKPTQSASAIQKSSSLSSATSNLSASSTLSVDSGQNQPNSSRLFTVSNNRMGSYDQIIQGTKFHSMMKLTPMRGLFPNLPENVPLTLSNSMGQSHKENIETFQYSLISQKNNDLDKSTVSGIVQKFDSLLDRVQVMSERNQKFNQLEMLGLKSDLRHLKNHNKSSENYSSKASRSANKTETNDLRNILQKIESLPLQGSKTATERQLVNPFIAQQAKSHSLESNNPLFSAGDAASTSGGASGESASSSSGSPLAPVMPSYDQLTKLADKVYKFIMKKLRRDLNS